MSTDYNYDDDNSFAPFFFLVLSGLITLPLSYTLLRSSKDLENTAPRIHSNFKHPDADLIDGQKRKQWRRERRVKRIITVVVGWLVIGWMIYLIMVTARKAPKLWDPYDILDISRSADEKAIKSHYKRLSIKFHPDKRKPDPALNETSESLNLHFVELTKAYKALTDEEVRNNFIQFGHPDGKQSFSIGIALPKFIVTDGNGKFVLLVYGLLLGVLLPYVVGKWWYNKQRHTKEGCLVASANQLFREYEEDLAEGGVTGALSAGEEYKDILQGERAESGLAKIESKVLGHGAAALLAKGMTFKDRQKLERLNGGVRRKTLALLWAYLGRVDLEDVTLNDEKYAVPPIALALNEAFLAIALAFTHTQPILSSFHASQCLIQAIPANASPLLQLPHITPKIAATIEGNSNSHMTVQQFMSLPDTTRRRLAIAASTGGGLLTNTQYQTAVAVAKQLPLLHVEKAYFKVTGERYITPSSLVQLVVKARFIPPGSTSVPAVNPTDLEDIDPDEGDLDAILGRAPSKKKLAAQAEKKGPSPTAGAESTDTTPIQPPLAHAPYFPRDHSPRWHVFLTDAKQGKIAVPPFTFSTFPNPIYKAGTSNEPTFQVQTLKMQFQAPPQAGRYTFVMHMICDSYRGMDDKREIVLEVEDGAKAEAMKEEDEISEPDEDSLAGQMSALKHGGLSGAGAPSGQKRKQLRRIKDEEESSDDEDESGSDTEGEEGEEDSDTDTDTDTDEE